MGRFAFLAPLRKQVLHRPGKKDFFSENAGDLHDLLLGEFRKTLHQISAIPDKRYTR